jgi:hypothetical protein
VEVLGKDRGPVLKAKYTGLHALRHFYASWCINRKKDGGLELPPKMVQERLGHANIATTMDTYGHLFPSGDDGQHGGKFHNEDNVPTHFYRMRFNEQDEPLADGTTG